MPFSIDYALVSTITLASIAAFIKSYLNGRELSKIHVLVNSRLTRAIRKIKHLQLQVSKLTGEPVPIDEEEDY